MDQKTSAIIGIILLCVALLATLLLYQSFFRKEKDPRKVIRSITCDAMIMAIILLMTFVPSIGYIQLTPFISFTLLHLPVLLGAAIGGWKKGLLFGFVFGVSSYINAFGSTGLNLLFAVPWIAIPPRMLFGLVAGIVFSLIGKLSKRKTKVLYLGLAAAGLTMLHTVFVFGDLYIFHTETIAGLFASTSPIGTGTTLTFSLIILFGMLGEMAIAAILIPPVVSALRKAVPSIFTN